MKQLPCIKQHVLGFEHFTSKLRPQPLNIALTQKHKVKKFENILNPIIYDKTLRQLIQSER